MATGDKELDGLLGCKLESFDLSTRAANCLRAAMVETIGQLVQLRSTDVLLWPNAGLRTLNEIRKMLLDVGLNLSDEGPSKGAGVSGLTPDVPAGGGESLLARKLDSFDLSLRTANILRAEDVETIGELVGLRSSDVLRWVTAGPTTLHEIRMLLASLGLKLLDDAPWTGEIDNRFLSGVSGSTIDSLLGRKLDSFDLSARTTNVLRAENVETIRELVKLRSADVLLWPNAGLKTLNEIRLMLHGVGLKLSDDDSLTRPIETRTPPAVVEPTVLEEELYCFVRTVCIERNAEILVKLWGWGGKAPRTLDSVGKEYAITRERVRQIEKTTLPRLRKHHIEAPLLRTAISTLRRSVPDTESGLGAALREHGVSRNEFGPRGLKSAAELLGMAWPFEALNLLRKKVLVLLGEGKTYRQAVALVRKKTSDQGCINILSLVSELKMEERRTAELRRVFDASSEVKWLDDTREWLYSSRPSRNRLLNLCSKVLGVAPRVHLSELRRAVSKSRRLAMCPPQRILGTFVQQCGLARVEGSFVLVNPGCGTAPAENSMEGVILRVLDVHGPAMDGDDFAERCIEAGVNAITFYIYRSYSPVICSLGKNVYCKVGASVPPGSVEDIVSRRRVVKRVSDYGWTSAGRLWCGTELSRMVITFGSIALPTFVTDFVQGDWNVVLPDGSEYGSVTCRDTFIWNFTKAFNVLGAEPTDLAVLEFDLKSRQVMIKVGGPDLVEAIQDPDSEILEEGSEEA